MKKLKLALGHEALAELDRVRELDGQSRSAMVRDAVREMLRERELRESQPELDAAQARPCTDG